MLCERLSMKTVGTEKFTRGREEMAVGKISVVDGFVCSVLVLAD